VADPPARPFLTFGFYHSTGIAIQNIGSQIKGDGLSTNIKLGCDVKIPEKSLNIGVEVDYPLSGKTSIVVMQAIPTKYLSQKSSDI